MLAGLPDRAGGTDINAGRAKDAPAQIQGGFSSGRPGDGVRRTDRHTSLAFVVALGAVQPQGTSMAVGQRGGGTVRVRHGLAAVVQPMKNGINGKHGQRSNPQ
jgi:hypothetical protein